MQICTVSQASAATRTFFVVEGQRLDQVVSSLSDREQQATAASVQGVDSLGRFGEVSSTTLFLEERAMQVVFVGLGKKDEFSTDRLRRAAGRAVKEWERLKSKHAAVYAPADVELVCENDFVKVVTEGCLLAEYRFDKYLSEKKPTALESVEFVTDADVEQAVIEGQVLAESTILARDLVNEPANVLSPIKLAEIASSTGDRCGFQVEVFDEPKIEELGMKAFLEVTRASANPARLIVMRYFGDKSNSRDIVGLVGKGLTYDSGGLSIKTGDGMVNMKCDMGGAAAVIGAMAATARLQRKVNAVAVVAACENMISGSGYRPGDIIESMAGKSIFIGSTDAEGRLTLADALHYAIEHEKVSSLVDVATLTGAAITALGHISTAVVTNDQGFYKRLETASELAGEKVWQLPNFPEYKEIIKSKIADLTNTGGREAGTVTAGLFLGEFVQNKPWLHLDVAGTAFVEKAGDYTPEGATGVGVRLLYHLMNEGD